MQRRLPSVLAWAALAFALSAAHASAESNLAAWEQTAKRVTITRDDWGVPHVHGKSDADAVFGLIYAQAEDDFNRVERNYLNALGRLAEAEGESKVFEDLRMRLIVDEDALKALYPSCPPSLKALMEAWADGLNFYLAKHPAVHPKVIARFEPWMVLAFTEGSIGWDIESVSLRDLQAFYGKPAERAAALAAPAERRKASGSNGFAIAGALTASKSPLLLINPHTTLFFRAEAQVQSDEGWNAYGAVTWGQFFVYQGWNERLGWMHTSTHADFMDEYAETIVRKPEGIFYRYGAEERPVTSRKVTIRYRTADGGQTQRDFTVYATHHGPVAREADGKWISVRLMQDPVNALKQSFGRNKTRNYEEFRGLFDLHTNSSNNTVYADADGNIAYFHANFVPRRDARFDWSKPVDGSDPATEWQGLHAVDESPNLKNPPNGWIQNTNNWPFSAAGKDSPRQADFPAYMDTRGENPRGLHAMRVLSARQDFTLDTLMAAAFDRDLTAFEELVPALVAAFRALPPGDPLRARLAEPVLALEGWDRRWSTESVETSVAIYWAQELSRRQDVDPDTENLPGIRKLLASPAAARLEALVAAIDKLTADFGTWKTPWGQINRYQRTTGDVEQKFDDAAPSVPIGFAQGQWGSLPAFDAKTYPGTKRMYGTGGNTFVAVVQFSKPLRAKAISAGGESSDPTSPYFANQVERYASGRLRDVYFYPDDVNKHAVKTYRPGE